MKKWIKRIKKNYKFNKDNNNLFIYFSMWAYLIFIIIFLIILLLIGANVIPI